METRLERAEPQRSILVFRDTDVDLLDPSIVVWFINMETLLIPVQQI